MNMAISVYEYGRGWKCVYMIRHTYAGIRKLKTQMEREDRHMRRVMRTSMSTVT
jgi:hypothetical protein